MQKERFPRRKVIALAGAGLVAAGLPQIASAQERQPEKQEEDSVLGELAVLAIMGFGFYVMVGGLNKGKSSGDPEIDKLQRDLDNLRRRRRK